MAGGKRPRGGDDGGAPDAPEEKRVHCDEAEEEPDTDLWTNPPEYMVVIFHQNDMQQLGVYDPSPLQRLILESGNGGDTSSGAAVMALVMLGVLHEHETVESIESDPLSRFLAYRAEVLDGIRNRFVPTEIPLGAKVGKTLPIVMAAFS